MKTRAALLLVLLGVLGCPTGETPRRRTPENFGDPASGDDGPSPASREAPVDEGPEVSRSRGVRGSMIVLWPRVVTTGKATAPGDLADKVQQRLEMLSKRAGGSRAVELRPAPEVSCPASGCEATSISAVVLVKEMGCAVVAVVRAPKKAGASILPWAGTVELLGDAVPFGASPVDLVKFKEGVPCDKLLEGREDKESAIARQIAGVLPGR